MGARGGYFRNVFALAAFIGCTLIAAHRAAGDAVTELPFFEGFESGNLATHWAVDGTENYYTAVVSDYGPASGLYHLVMACTENGTLSRNETTLSINLSDYEHVMLSFDAINYSDEPDGPPSYPFIDHADFDGVAVSADGIYWYEVASLRDLSRSYSARIVDLDAAIAAAGISHTSPFRIRFNHYDNYMLTTDGIGIDNILITGDPRDALSISPNGSQVIFGYENGPFSPANLMFNLQNKGSNTMSWAVDCTNSWLHLSATGGVLAAGSTGTVQVVLHPDVNTWEPATNAATIVFTNETSGFVQYREIRLEIAERVLDHFEWEPVGTNQVIGVPFPVVLTARDATGQILTDYDGDASLTVVNEGFSEQLLNFDDIDTGGGTWGEVPASYHGYTFSNVGLVNAITYDTPSGYQVGLISPSNIVYNSWADPCTISSTGTFTVVSAYFTAAWRNSLGFRAQGYLGSTLLYDSTYSLSNTNSMLINLDYEGIDQIRFSSDGSQFAMDDLLLSNMGSKTIPIIPTNTGSFVGGVWTGSVTVTEAVSNVVLRAQNSDGYIGDSNPFDVHPLMLSLVLPDALTEGDGPVKAGVLANFPSSSNLLVTLERDLTNDLAVPPSVVLPAGQTHVAFDIQAVDDGLLDGTAVVTITATTTNYLPAKDSMHIYDNESAALALALPQTTYEGAGTISGALTADAAPDVDVIVQLISNNTNEIGSGTAVLPAGQTFASITLPVSDDALIDGVQTATIEAYVENWQSGYASVFTFDNETTGIELQLPVSLTEGDGVITNGGIATIPATALADVNLLLTSSDPAQLDVPDYVTIPAGTNQVMFDVSVFDDIHPEGMTTVSVLAQASGYIPDSANVSIIDNDPHHFLVAGVTNVPLFEVLDITVSARTMEGDLVDTFSETVTFTARGDRGAVAVSPASLTNMVGGMVSGSVTFGNIGDDVRLEAGGGGLAGTSTAFKVTGSLVTIAPAALTNTLVIAGASTTRSMIISNSGNADLEFEIQEIPVYTNHVINGDFEAGNSGFTSTYVYTPAPNSQAKGIYTVADDSKTWNGSFTTTMKDHTSGSGQMLMADGNSTGTAMVWQQEVPVAAGVKYAVSAWTASLFGEFLATLDFQVDGASIGSITTENLTWTRFSSEWTASVSGTVTFRIIDTQFIPHFLPGNHFAIDDIVFKPSYVPVVSDTQDVGLIASYPFNGNVNDVSGNGHDGTANGTTLASDRFGNADSAYHFDGVNDYIDLGNMSGIKTVSIWVKQALRSDFDFYFGHDDFRLYASTVDSGRLSFGDGGGAVTTPIHMDDQTDQWVHVVAVSDGANSRVYFNGTNVTVIGRTMTTVRTNAVNLGRWTGGTHYLNGDLDDVRIYDRVLSDQEIQNLYNESDPAETIDLQSGLVAGYFFNGDASDVSANGYDGTPVGATLMTNRFGEADSAYYFDGIDDRIDLPGEALNFERTDAFSKSLWIKSSEDGVLLAKQEESMPYRGSRIWLPGGQIRIDLVSSVSSDNWITLRGYTVLNDDQWHHIAVTYDGSSTAAGINVYIDGYPEDLVIWEDSLTGSIVNGVTPRIGTASGSGNPFDYFGGAIDDVCIYDRVLSDAEITALYTADGTGLSVFNPVDVSWLSVTPEFGSIPPGSNLTVAVAFDAAGATAGDYSNALLKVDCNDVISPSNDVPASMYAIPTAPVMDPEPETTYGSTNAVSWSAVDGPVSYLVEVATDTVSAPQQQSAWRAATNHTFNALATNQMYYYRARASVESDIGRLEGPWSGWVWSTQLPVLADGDQDGMPDWWEELYFGGTGVAGLLTDFDGDGQSDCAEYIAGMNPTNAASHFMIDDTSVPTNGQFVVYWNAVSGRVYHVQWKASMTNAFAPIATNLFYPQGSYTDDVHQAESSGFYRIEVEIE